MVTISAEGKITDMNEALVNITGLSRCALTGTDFTSYFTETQKAKEVYQEIFSKGSVADSPLTIRHKDGKETDDDVGLFVECAGDADALALASGSAVCFSGVSYYTFSLFYKKNNGVILCRLPDLFHVQY